MSYRLIKANKMRQTPIDLCQYLNQYEIEGWLIPGLFTTLTPLHQLIGAGPIAEIGVFHGKFFFALKCLNPNASAVAIDCFDLQEFNLDRAGEGSLQEFQKHQKALGFEVTICKADSLDLPNIELREIFDSRGKAKWFSVDGCHTSLHTQRDVLTAMEFCAPTGIIFVDDYTNPDWPGVSEGMMKLYDNYALPFTPFCCTSNKLLLCKESYREKYVDYIANVMAKAKIPTKRVTRLGFGTINVKAGNEYNNDRHEKLLQICQEILNDTSDKR